MRGFNLPHFLIVVDQFDQLVRSNDSLNFNTVFSFQDYAMELFDRSICLKATIQSY